MLSLASRRSAAQNYPLSEVEGKASVLPRTGRRVLLSQRPEQRTSIVSTRLTLHRIHHADALSSDVSRT